MSLDLLTQRDLAPMYDALIVDEAQDINKPVWPVLRRLLRASDDPEEPAASRFYVFYDPAQRDLPGEWDATWTGIDVIHPPLTINCRNSASIYELMATFNPRLHDIPFRGPIGRPVLFRDPMAEKGTARETGKNTPALRTIDAETATLEQVLNELIEQEGARPEQILVVTCRSGDGRSKHQTRWRLRDQQEIGRRSLEWIKSRKSQTRVALSTIRAAKGLESPIVVLAELDGIVDEPRHDQLLFTAISRAKHQLIVLAPPNALHPQQPGWWERFFRQKTAPQELNPNHSAQPTVDNPFVGPDDSGPDDPIYDHADHHEISKGSARDRARDGRNQPNAPEPPLRVASDAIVYSPHQQAIFDFVRSGSGNGIVSAVAGSGKTTTLLSAAKLLDTRNALFLAFNKSIAEKLAFELQSTPMTAQTIHSIGWRTLGRYWGSDADMKPDNNKYVRLSHAWVDDNLTDLDHPRRRQASGALRELVDFTRATLTTPTDVCARSPAACPGHRVPRC